MVPEILQRRLEPWRWGVQWPAIWSSQRPIEKIFEADSLTTTGEVAEEFHVDHSMLFGILKQIGKAKQLDKGGTSWADHKLKKKLSFWSVILSYSMQQRQTISWSDCDMRWKVDFIQQAETTSSVFKWRRCSKALPKAKLAPKKGHGHRPVAFCLSDPLQLSESRKNLLHLRCILRKLMRCTENWSVQLTLVNKKDSFFDNTWLHVAQPVLQKLNELGYKVLSHLPYCQVAS